MNASSTGASSHDPVGFGARLAATLFLFFFLALGLTFVWLILRDALPGLQTWTWVKTGCQVISSDIRASGGRRSASGNFVVEVSYRYTFGGQSFTSQTLGRKPRVFQDYTDAAHVSERYRPEAAALCYVNPAAPAEVVLERGSLLFPLVALFPLLFVALGAGGVYATWRRKPFQSVSARPISDRSGFGLHPSVGVGFVLVFLLIGGGLLYAFFLRPLMKIVIARDWVAVPCTVISSEVKSQRGNHGSTYSVNVLYSYEFAGGTHKANRYDFMGGSSSGYAGKRHIVDGLPPGSKTRCFVNPRDPAEAVLERGFTPTMWFGLIPMAFVLGGLFFLVKLRNAQKSQVSQGFPVFSRSLRSAQSPVLYAASSSEPRVLSSQSSPAKVLAFILLFAVFWNGVISVGLSSMLRGSHSNPLNWFLLLFMVPFVLVGLALVGAVVYFFLALFNPRPRITITPGAVPLGGALRIEWELNGRTDVLRSFDLRLQGSEEATYRSGKNSTTDKNVFADLEIAATTVAQEMRSGTGGVTIPANLMHSFTSTHNKIIWSIRVHGEIARWPDLQEEFAVTVLPAEGAPQNDL